MGLHLALDQQARFRLNVQQGQRRNQMEPAWSQVSHQHRALIAGLVMAVVPVMIVVRALAAVVLLAMVAGQALAAWRRQIVRRVQSGKQTEPVWKVDHLPLPMIFQAHLLTSIRVMQRQRRHSIRVMQRQRRHSLMAIHRKEATAHQTTIFRFVSNLPKVIYAK